MISINSRHNLQYQILLFSFSFSRIINMLTFSQLSKDVNAFTDTIQIIEKIDNKLGKSIAFDRANYKLQQIKNRMYQTMDQIGKNIQNRKPINQRLVPLTALPRSRQTEPEDFLSQYLRAEQKRDERFNRYKSTQDVGKTQQFRKTKKPKGKNKLTYKFHGDSNLKHQHNRVAIKQLSQEQYKQGMYTLASKYKQDDIDMNYIQQVMPKPMKNPIVRRNLDSIFVTKNQNNATIYDELIQRDYFERDQTNIFLTHHNDPFINFDFTQIHKKEKVETGTDNIKAKTYDGPSLNVQNYKLVINDVLKTFKLQNLYRWSTIQNLLKRCEISSIRIKSKQLIKLSAFCKKIPDKFLLRCLSNPEQIEQVLMKQRKSKIRNPESAASFIQNYWRYHRHLRTNTI